MVEYQKSDIQKITKITHQQASQGVLTMEKVGEKHEKADEAPSTLEEDLHEREGLLSGVVEMIGNILV